MYIYILKILDLLTYNNLKPQVILLFLQKDLNRLKNKDTKFKINKILKKFETGNKLDSYKELQKIFKKKQNKKRK